MLESIVEFAVRRRALVLALSGLVVVVGIFMVPKLPIDAVPDVTNVQVVILTEAAGFRPRRWSASSPIRSRWESTGCLSSTRCARSRAAA